MPSLSDSLAQSAGDTLHISMPPLLSPDSVPAFGGYVVPPMADYQAVARMFGDSVPPACDRATIWREAATLMQPDGVVGKPVAWSVRYDDAAVGTLLLGLFILVWTAVGARHFIGDWLGDFFRNRKRANLFAKPEEKVLRGGFFMIVLSALALGVFGLHCTVAYAPAVFHFHEPWCVLALCTALPLLVYALKFALGSMVDSVFFAAEARRKWGDMQCVIALFMGGMWLLLDFVMTYAPITIEHALIAAIVIALIGKIMLLYKTLRIFFAGNQAYVHIFLYFCTLELVPALFAWRAIALMSHYLQQLN